ncbi:flagellar basal body rod protein FlgB [Bosea sp. (in: a-proteobacteria)]|jgi:flagellar basal-body rod protein FlgB|uniref:Flagellar basal body rod protein FlgB n=1 Tax=Bosea vestrisii TaxID=151416 RepID=A0ABW0HFT0_9HYPH|nr:flagellar basal body rod protein FlgB [Bosea sp. (in: a-proteobacteria)]MBA4223580.1 flagellar basal body rod protein FlgB [Methylobacterium sp.]MBR3194953.1 flagellar basal body rod protein FlgB [Bosea sp. (in: a-proteobacteria)]
MANDGLGLMGALKARMHWHQARQKLLAENVSNADTPRFKPHDLRAPSPAGTGGVTLAQTSPLHLGLSGQRNGFDPRDPKRFETTPSGNSVNLEDEMMKVAQNQSDYQLAASLYSKSLGLMKIAIGKGR